jgi:hypothetical protein
MEPGAGGTWRVLGGVGAGVVFVLGLGFAVWKWRQSGAKPGDGNASTAVAAKTSTGPGAPLGATVVDAAASFEAGPAEAGAEASADAEGANQADEEDVTDAGRYQADLAVPPWFLEHRSTFHRVGECGGDESTEFPRLRFESDAGARRVLNFPAIDHTCPLGDGRTTAVQELFDYDGDGLPELLVVTELVGGPGVYAEESAIWTLRGRHIQPFQGDAGPVPSFAQVDDVDGDGRPDLLSRGGFTEVAGASSCGESFVAKPIFLQHSLRGGGFSRDAVARKYLEDTCGSDSLEAVLENTTDLGHELGTAIACARARGATTEAVTRTLRKVCGSFSESTCDAAVNDAGKILVCPTWALELSKKNVEP